MRTLFVNHLRLWASVVVGIAPFMFLPPHWSVLSRVLVCWNLGVLVFLVLIFSWMSRLSAQQICRKYIEEDESAPFILIAVAIAAGLSLVAIIDPLASLRKVSGLARAGHSALAAVTLVQSWVLVPTMFTTHYADMFYSASESERPLNFPNTAMPVFWDFAYFSFTIAAACQTADVSTNAGDIRRVVLGQSLLAFIFNAWILGFAINVTAGLLAGN